MDTDEWEDMLRMHERQLYELTNIWLCICNDLPKKMTAPAPLRLQ
jgi:hypothetical protein